MRPRRGVWTAALTGLLVIGAPVAATRAGANVEVPTGVGPIAVPKRVVPRHAASRTVAGPDSGRRAVRRALAPKQVHRNGAKVDAPPPSMCEAVVASVGWPKGWHTKCVGARPGLLGLTSPVDDTTTLYVRAGEGLETMHVVALHEAGHAWDFAGLDGRSITRWCASRGCDPQRFFSGGSGGADWGQPGGAEDWAAVWDACHGGGYHRSYLGFGPPTAPECTLQNALVGYTG